MFYNIYKQFDFLKDQNALELIKFAKNFFLQNHELERNQRS